MGKWRSMLWAFAALCVVACHANTKTAGRQSLPQWPMPAPAPAPAPPDSGKACSCAGMINRALDCSNRGRSAFTSKDLCSGRTTKVDLSRNSFTTFPPTLGSYVVEVNISRNQLAALPRSPPLNAKTTVLDVSGNRISQASSELKALTSLKKLSVAGNRLQSLSFLPEPCALERLDAQRNSIRSLEGPLRKCSKLEFLDLSYNQMSSLPRGAFSGLKELEHLELIKSGLLNLAVGVFEGLEDLEILRLENNGLTTLPLNVFSPLKDLKKMFLDNNNLANLPNDIFVGLKNIDWLSLTGNKLTHLPRSCFNSNTKVRTIVLSNNQLRSLPEGVFSGLQKLENVGLHTNKFATLPARLFAGLSSLKIVSLSDNLLTTLPSDIFSGVKSMELIDLHNNQLTALPSGLFREMKSIRILDLSHNRFTTFNGRDFTGLKTIWRLDLSNNPITTLPMYDKSWPEITFTFLENHRITDVDESRLRSWINSGDKDKTKLLDLGNKSPLRSPGSLRWILGDDKIATTVASNCKCGGINRGKIEINFCVAVSCPGSTASWLQAVRAAAPPSGFIKGR